MAFKRQRGNAWEFIVKRAGVLDKPLSLTFQSEAEGDDYCRNLEKLLDRGIVPTEYRVVTEVRTVGQLIDKYTSEHAVKPKDAEVLRTVSRSVGAQPLALIDANWVDGWVSRMKREDVLAPATIRSKVGALARCTDWGVRKKLLLMPDHPFRTLPDGYATYTDDDAAFSGVRREDEERDQRIAEGEEAAIRKVIAVGVLPRKQRPLEIGNARELLALFDLALESAMRLSEMYTLEWGQVHLGRRTVFLEKTKNGDKRQVPLTTTAMSTLRSLEGLHGDFVFPWLPVKGTRKNTSNYISKLFSDITAAAGCGAIRFHDTRHEATSRLFERTNLSTEQIMKITGHRSHRMMMRYLNLRGSDLADQLW